MTQPIQEPLTTRSISRLDWGNNQLFRRPDPNANSPWEEFRAARWISDITVGGTTQVTVLWDAWNYCNTDVFEPLDPGGTLAVPGVDQVETIRLNQDGYYHIIWGAHPTTAIAGTVEMAIHDGDDIWSRPEIILHADNTGLSADFYSQTWLRVYPWFDPFGGSSFTPTIRFTLAQNGGSSEDFSEAFCDIYYQASVNYCDPDLS